jgi:hypothetical protein
MKKIILYLSCVALFSACSKLEITPNETPDAQNGATFQTEKPTTAVVLAPDTTFRPIVMVHGFLASGDTYASFAQRFTSNGYKWSRIYVFDWNSLAFTANNTANLDKFIDNILAKTGYKQVELMGHSAGGGVCYTYLQDATRAAKVAHYVHVASSAQTAPAGSKGDVPTLNLWSDGDKTVKGSDILGAKNIKLDNLDHYQVATSPASFSAAYEFFKNEKPATTSITWESNPCIGGRALTFGENQPAANAEVKIYELNSLTGERLSPTPIHSLTTDANGNWKPVFIKPNVNYEITVKEQAAGKRTLHYYREGFTHNNLIVYLRTIPPPTTTAGFLLAGLPTNPEQSVLNVFASSQAVVNGRDSLKVDGIVHSTPQTAPASKTLISLFLYDNNKNQKTDLTAIPTFNSFSFLNGLDQFFDAADSKPIEIKMNERRLVVRKWKASEDVIVAVFD